MNALSLYRAATTLVGPLVPAYLRRRAGRGKEDPTRLGERRGETSRLRPAGPLVWVHAASIGESLSMLGLLARILDDHPHVSALVTTGTLTSARLLETRLGGLRAVHQFVPLDRARYVRRFLEHWHPDLAIWVESELWPNLILETRQHGIPMLLVNARMSARSFARWRRLPGVIRPLLSAFQLCLAQDQAAAERLWRLGADHAECVGNLKAAAAPLAADAAELERLRRATAGRSLWLAASTHPGEEDAVASAHAALRGVRPHLLTIIVPRHPSRGGEIAERLQAQGLRVTRRSAGALPGAETEIYLADTLGELGLFYRLAPIVFVGGSLARHGGHNPIEAALLGCAILIGPDTSNCSEAAAALIGAGGGETVVDERALADALGRLLQDPALLSRRVAASREVASAGAGVLDAVYRRLGGWLDRLPSDPRRARA